MILSHLAIASGSCQHCRQVISRVSIASKQCCRLYWPLTLSQSAISVQPSDNCSLKTLGFKLYSWCNGEFRVYGNFLFLSPNSVTSICCGLVVGAYTKCTTNRSNGSCALTHDADLRKWLNIRRNNEFSQLWNLLLSGLLTITLHNPTPCTFCCSKLMNYKRCSHSFSVEWEHTGPWWHSVRLSPSSKVVE